MSKVGKILWYIFVFIVSIASLVEAVVGFLPLGDASLPLRVLFMGFAFLGASYGMVTFLFSSFVKKNDLTEQIRNGLILTEQKGRIDDTVLLRKEFDLPNAFHVESGKFRIIIISKCVDTNEKKYIRAVWNNIEHGIKYLYITQDTDTDFTSLLINKFMENGHGDDPYAIYNKIRGNVIHISQPSYFTMTPQFFDLCLYIKEINGNASKEGMFGYCCYQEDEILDEQDLKHYFYNCMTQRMTNEIFVLYADKFKQEIFPAFLSEKLEKRLSTIHGYGLFCTSDIKKGEVVAIKGGRLLSRDKMVTESPADSYLPITDELCLAAGSCDEAGLIKLYINHSCESNCYMLNDRTMAAKRQIKANEEITIDYAYIDNEKYEFPCNCRSASCRKIIKGDDWIRIKDQNNKRYFSPYLREKK